MKDAPELVNSLIDNHGFDLSDALSTVALKQIMANIYTQMSPPQKEANKQLANAEEHVSEIMNSMVAHTGSKGINTLLAYRNLIRDIKKEYGNAPPLQSLLDALGRAMTGLFEAAAPKPLNEVNGAPRLGGERSSTGITPITL